MIKIPSTQALQSLEASLRLGSFTAAAKELHVTQAGISRQIKTMEQGLGLALLQRNARGLRLTEAGEQFWRRVEPALQEIISASANLKSQRQSVGVLNLSIPASWGNYWLLPKLPQLYAQQTRLGLNLFTKVGVPDFSSKSLDAAVFFSLREPAEFLKPQQACELIMSLDLLPVASPAWQKRNKTAWQQGQVPAEQLMQHTTVPQAWIGWWAQHRPNLPVLSPADVRKSPRYEVMFMAMNAACNDGGAAMLPRYMIDPLLANGKLVLLSKKPWRSSGGYYLQRSPWLRQEVIFQSFREWLLMQLEAGSTP